MGNKYEPPSETNSHQQNGQTSHHSASAPSEELPPAYSDICQLPIHPQPQPPFTHYPQPPFTHYPQPNQQQPIIQQQPQVQHVVVYQMPLDNRPVNTICPSCHASIMTRVSFEANMTTHFMALLLCLFCTICSCLPYCMESCQTTVHYCPNCGANIGSRQDDILGR